MQAQTPGAQNQPQAPGTKPGSGVSNFWNTYMDAVRSYFFPQNAGTQTATQTGQNGMQTQIPGAAQPGTQTQVPGTAQPDGQPQTQGTAQPNFQTQVPGESQPNAQAQTEKGQPLSPEKRIPELTAAIKKSGLTTGKATIAAQTLYQTAQQYGPNAEAMLAAYEPGQDPKRFASGFQNAYILGTQGNQTALQNSKAAAYLTQEQRETAYELGSQSQGQNLAQNQLDSADSSDIMERKRLNTVADPMREVTGPGWKSNPQEIQAYISEMEQYGVEIKTRKSGMAYSPGLSQGSPGMLIIEEDASFSAWCHEYKHFCDDRDAGFMGMRVLEDTEKCIQMEKDAYQIEIDMAEQANRKDIADRLRELMINEVKRRESSISD